MEWLLRAITDKRLFKRNKATLDQYMAGLSTRQISKGLRLVPTSREAVRQWVHRVAKLRGFLKPRERLAVAVDEIKLKLNGDHLFVWAAVDVDSKDLLAVDASW